MRDFVDRPLAYARIPARRPEAAARFAAEIFGLEPADATANALRADARRQALAFMPEPSTPAIGVEVSDEAVLARIVERLRAAGHPCQQMSRQACAQRGVRDGVTAREPSGTEIELIVRAELSARRFYPTRDSGVSGLSAAGLRSRVIARDLLFWTDCIGAEISDRVGDIAYLRLDATHHRIALYPSEKSGLLYLGVGVRTHDDLMRNAYFLQERQVRIVHGPGAETASGRVFVRFLSPEGQMFALDFDAGGHEAGRPARQFALDRYALCGWGSPCRDIPELAAA
ncbi:MAG: VOC family protein [Hyphomicrobiales bacterium]|nr:VOC family protein [Hyphomicrobiales bacterium]